MAIAIASKTCGGGLSRDLTPFLWWVGSPHLSFGLIYKTFDFAF